MVLLLCCILLNFYIKPQHNTIPYLTIPVVSYWISTSNHNKNNMCPMYLGVVSYWISTSNHNTIPYHNTIRCILLNFYIKPQLVRYVLLLSGSCILLNFYIKPQPRLVTSSSSPVVSYWISTSNHNNATAVVINPYVVSYWISTSNHNWYLLLLWYGIVVSYWISTSNHNPQA